MSSHNVSAVMDMRSISLAGIPLYTLTKNHGMGTAVQSLRHDGIVRTLRERIDQFRDSGDVTLPSLTSDEGPPNLRNYNHFLNCTNAIFDVTRKMLEEEGMILNLGGECGLILGSAAGLKQDLSDKLGLLWIDAHGDFNTPETTRSGFVGGMPLAFVCGRGPRFSLEIEKLRPIIHENAVVHLGGRDFDSLESEAIRSSEIKLYSPSRFRENGVEKTAAKIAGLLADQSDWLICHLDVDAIDPSIMPAVDYPSPGGLTLAEVRAAMRAIAQTGKLRAFNLAAYDSSLDKGGVCAKVILDLVSGFSLYKSIAKT
jgi:arginase